MRAETIVRKLQLQELATSEREARQKRYGSAHTSVQDKVVKQQKLDRLVSLRKKTDEINFQLELDRQLAAESKKCFDATMKLRESRLTPAERKEREEETRRGQILFSRIVPENHPDWKRQAQEEFNSKKI